MNKLKLNPNNAKYYSDDFIKGFECGVERQFNADMTEKIMSRYIDADKIEYESNINYHGTDYKMTSEIYINNMPTEDVKPIVYGEWICVCGSSAVCNKCNRLNQMYGDFCKYCGADMRKEQTE